MTMAAALEIRKVGALAKVVFTDAEIERLGPQVSAIVGYFNRLKTLDLAAVEPSSHVVPITCPVRADQPEQTRGTADRLPYFRLSFFFAPRAIE